MYTKMFICLLLCAMVLQIANADLPVCVWYGAAPFCGSGRTCPGSYPYKIDQCTSSDQGMLVTQHLLWHNESFLLNYILNYAAK